jgi:hypothetical protein
MTFLVNHDGVVYQKDLGPNTLALGRQMKQFNPDATWTKVDAAALEPLPGPGGGGRPQASR